MKSEFNRISEILPAYLKRIRYAAAALTLYTLLLHLRRLTALIPGIDTEHLIGSPEALYYSWLGVGRQGLYFIKFISGNKVFNPDFAALLTLLLLVPVCLFIPFLGSLAAGKTNGCRGENWLVLLLGMLIVSHPILTEQFYFTLQSAEVVFSMLLLELSLLCAHFGSLHKNPRWLPLVFLLLQIPFSTYQAFVPLFIAGAVGMALSQSLFTEKPIREQRGYVLRFSVAFLGGFILNQIITRLFFLDSAYLEKQFQWDSLGFTEGVLKILSHIRDACLGHAPFYFTEFGLLYLLLFALVLWHCLKSGNAKANIWRLFLLFAWFLSPFYLSILLGVRPVARAQLTLPFATGGTAFLCGFLLLQKKEAAAQEHSSGREKIICQVSRGLLILLSLSAVYREASVTSRLYYSDAIRAQGDYALAVSLRKDIQEFTGEEDYLGTVIFWGSRDASQNPSCIQGEIMGQSFFSWDTDMEPRYFYSSNRIVDFMNSLGSSYAKPHPILIEKAAEAVEGIPCYPSPGSIFWTEEALVVKLSEK